MCVWSLGPLFLVLPDLVHKKLNPTRPFEGSLGARMTPAVTGSRTGRPPNCGIHSGSLDFAASGPKIPGSAMTAMEANSPSVMPRWSREPRTSSPHCAQNQAPWKRQKANLGC